MILYGDPIGTPQLSQVYPEVPSGMPDLWDRLGKFLGGAAAMISPRHFVFVNHVGGAIGDKLAIAGENQPLLWEARFAANVSGWTTQPGSGGAATVSWNAGGWLDWVTTTYAAGGRIVVTTTVPGTVGNMLHIKFRAKAGVATTLNVTLNNAATHLAENFPVTTDWREYSFQCPITSGAGSAILIYLTLGSTFTGTVSVDDVEVRAGLAYNTVAKASSGDVCVYTLDRDVPPLVRNGIARPRHFRIAAYMGLDASPEYPAIIASRWMAKSSVLTGGSGAQGWNVTGSITEQRCWGTQGLPQRATANTASVDFDNAEGNSEAAIHLGDSGAPLFIYQSGEYRLAGIAYATDSLVWGTTYAGRQNAVVYNRLGLFGPSTSAQTQSTGQANLHHSMAGFQAFITGVVPDAFDIFSKPYGRILDKIPVT